MQIQIWSLLESCPAVESLQMLKDVLKATRKGKYELYFDGHGKGSGCGM